MVASVKQIERDIAKLTGAVTLLSTEFYRTYTEYLKALGQAVRQQLILSGYHACTQGYPIPFLALSVSQRQALQQDLRSLARQTEANLVALLQIPDADEQANPDQLGAWQEALEAAIVHELRTAGGAGNQLLQQAKIMPNKLPEFLQATSRSELFDADADASDLLNLLEGEQNSNTDDEQESSKITAVIQIVAIGLQLSDVEFADAATTVLRNRLRSLTARLKTLRQHYRKKERELAIARAQDAWRATWHED